LGRAAKKLLEESRERLAAALKCSVHELFFTSGGTESNHLALRGVMAHPKMGSRRLAVSAFEHPSVLETAKALQAEGRELDLIPPDGHGYVTVAAVQPCLIHKPALLSVIFAHNELGTIMPIADIAAAAHAVGVLMHTDAVQAFGRMGPISVHELGIDLLSASGHKLGGLKGAGLLYVKSGTPFAPQMLGGPQERQMRAGTENVLAIAAMAEAYAVWNRIGEAWRESMAKARQSLLSALAMRIPDMQVNGESNSHGNRGVNPHLSNTLHVTFPGCASDLLVLALDMQGICVSAGAACASGSVKASQVMLAMGRSEAVARSVLRFSLGPDASVSAMPGIAERVAAVVSQIRK
jgi:cysteine desulfurase